MPKVDISKVVIEEVPPKTKQGGSGKMTFESLLLKHPRLVDIMAKSVEIEALVKKAEAAAKTATAARRRLEPQRRIIRKGAGGLESLIDPAELQAHIAAISEALPGEADWLTELLNQIEEVLSAGRPARSDEEMEIEEKIQKAMAGGRSYSAALLELSHHDQAVLFEKMKV